MVGFFSNIKIKYETKYLYTMVHIQIDLNLIYRKPTGT